MVRGGGHDDATGWASCTRPYQSAFHAHLPHMVLPQLAVLIP